jgi:U3 small nucleolar RNA-associated protein 20
MTLLTTLPTTPPFHVSILRLSTATLLASSSHTTSCRTVLDRMYSTSPYLYLSLLGALAELSWSAWRALGIPAVLRRTPEMLEKGGNEGMRARRLCVDLIKSRKLTVGDVDGVWKMRTGRWVRVRLEGWERTEESIEELRDDVLLAQVLPSFADLLVKIVDKLLETDEPMEDYIKTPANAGVAIGMCLKALASDEEGSWVEKVNWGMWVDTAVRKWAWCSSVMEGLVAVVNTQCVLIIASICLPTHRLTFTVLLLSNLSPSTPYSHHCYHPYSRTPGRCVSQSFDCYHRR